MSYWIYLEKDGKTVEVDNHSEGGTYVLGGTTEADMSVTYNYSMVTIPVGFRFSGLHDVSAADSIPTLERVVKELGTEQDDDYWAPTPGNAGYAANILLKWARQHPDAVWRVS